MRPYCFLVSGFLALLIAACRAQATQTETAAQPLPANTSQPSLLPTKAEAPVAPQPQACEDWPSWPAIPAASDTARRLYQGGQADGNNPRAFSKIGDGEIAAAWFLSAFDLGQEYYDLGPYQDLTPVIENFEGSFGRIGMAARRGFDTGRILDPAERDRDLCEAG